MSLADWVWTVCVRSSTNPIVYVGHALSQGVEWGEAIERIYGLST